METAVQPPANYTPNSHDGTSCRDVAVLDEAGPSGTQRSQKITQHSSSTQQNQSQNNRRFADGFRKRRGSFGNADKFKRRRRNDMVLPTKFMLGGNINDPLNLKSLDDEEVNRLANTTPVASPAPTPKTNERVEVIIPRNINDPLNLNEEEPEQEVLKKNRRRRNRKKRNPPGAEEEKDDLVSRKQQQHQRFRYGNYNRYYGYRNAGEDVRLPLLKKKWFEDKVCLDIGCNIGHVTLTLARDHSAKQMIGLDIDQNLIRIAKKNLRNYVHEYNTSSKWFPVSCALTFGPIAMAAPNASFPHNVFFLAGNYVLDSDQLLETQREEFDTICCFSTTKWIQLNFGDDGLKRVFKRIFKQLRAGGRFILEPQPLSSYHKFCTAEHRENFRKMQLKPDDYPDYLTKEVGFRSCKLLAVAKHGEKGFQRPIYLLKKPNLSQDGCENGKPSKPSTPLECDTTTGSI